MLTLHYAPDNASLIVRLVLEELEQPFDTVLIDRPAREQAGEAYRTLNPRGLIPVLETPDGPIFETAAILLWLSEAFSKMAPQPGAADRAAFLSWLFYLSNGLHADMRMLFYGETYIGDGSDAQTSLARHTQARIDGHLALFDECAGAGHGWFSAEQPSIIDYYLATCLRWLALYPKQGCAWFDIDKTPALRRLAERMEQRPAALRAAEAEGLGETPFSAPRYAEPTEGSAT